MMFNQKATISLIVVGGWYLVARLRDSNFKLSVVSCGSCWERL